MDTKSKASSKSRRDNGEELSLRGVSLFKLDVNYDHLKQFLEGVQTDIDIHTEQIDALKKLVGPNEIMLILQEQYTLLSESLTISDKDMQKELAATLSTYMNQIQGKQKNAQGPMEKIIIELRGKLFSVVNILQHLFRDKARTDDRITKLEQEILMKYDAKECKEKMRKQKNTLETQIEELQRTSRADLDKVEKKLTSDIQKFEDSVRDVERKTLWKIQDCQDLLVKRINEEFVMEAIRTSEEKLMKEIAQLQGNDSNLKFSQELAYLRSTIKGLDDNIGEKQQKLKLQLNDMSDQLKSKLGLIDKLTEQGRQQGDKIVDLNSRLATAINKLDVQYQIDQQRQKMKQLEDAIAKLVEEQRQKVEAMKDMTLNADNVAFLLSKIDPHKICCLEADVKKLEEMTIRNNVHWETLDGEFKTRYDSFQFFSQLYSQQQQEQKADKDYITKDDLNRMFLEQQQKVNLEDDKLQRIQKDLAEMSKKVENANEIERRVTRIFKDLDINQLIKTVKLKANEDEMKKELLKLENLIQLSQETLAFLRREIDALQVQMKRSPQGFPSATSPPSDQQVGLNTKKLYPINCLSCTAYPSTQQRVRGYDGKYYQADVKKPQQQQQQQFDNFQEFYEDTQPQMHAQSRPQSAVVNKSVNAKNRPISAKK